MKTKLLLFFFVSSIVFSHLSCINRRGYCDAYSSGGARKAKFKATGGLPYPSGIQLAGSRKDEGTEVIINGDEGIAQNAERSFLMNIPVSAHEYERYSSFEENQWIRSADEVKSTFSIDVDQASYTNFRRYVNEGQLPPKDAIRLEEWLNYFNYNLEAPSANDEHPLKITSEIASCPWEPEDDLLMIKLQGKKAEVGKDLPPSNLVFLVDVSGSMGWGENKLELAKTSMKKLVKQLRSQDKMSIVTYAGSSEIILPPTSGDQKSEINKAIEKLNAGGGTHGEGGIHAAYKLAEENFNTNSNNRIILASDGDWNMGKVSDKDLKKLIEEKRETGIYLSVLGFGMGNYNDGTMEILADNGNGNYAYVDSEKEADRIFGAEFSGAMYTIAEDVKLQVEFNEEVVESYRLIGYENRVLENWQFEADSIDAGDLGMGQNVIAFYQIKRKKDSSGKLGKVDFRYKKPQTDNSLLLSYQFDSKTNSPSSDFQFASAVIEFGLCLRQSEYRGNAQMKNAILRGQKNVGNPEDGLSYEKRVEFVGVLNPLNESWDDYVTEEAPQITEKKVKKLKLYPNPVVDVATIEIPEELNEQWSIQLFDMNGALKRVEHVYENNTLRLSLGDLPAGPYIIHVYDETGSIGYLKMIKS
ncbi:MAG: von Willebrand factor type A domain-containing protein [Flavobacteriales bacterium]|nr:von Willebrand factor type A domain-containing protein [Flavobacteriales bacterium]